MAAAPEPPTELAEAMALNPEITAFNDRLVIGRCQIPIREYVTALNAAIFKSDIEGFANDLLALVNRPDCCISHGLLLKYGVLTNEKDLAHDALKLFGRHDFVENVDFRLLPNFGSKPQEAS